MNTCTVYEILLVEDNPADVQITQKAFAMGELPTNISVVVDAVEALRFLRRQPPYETSARPDLVLLDLNLPRKGGREFLAEVKRDPRLQTLRILVLTTSRTEEDECYDLGADCYLVKPLGMTDFKQMVHGIEELWLTDGSTKSQPRAQS